MPMLNKRGQCEVELGGAMRRLIYNTKTFAIIEQKLNRGISEVLSTTSIGLNVMTHLVWAGNLAEDPKRTPDEVFEWIDDVDSLADLMGEISPAMTEGMPGGKKLFAIRKEEAAEKSPQAEREESAKSNSSTPTAS